MLPLWILVIRLAELLGTRFVCKAAYLQKNNSVQVFINGEEIKFSGINNKALMDFCNKRKVNPLHHLELAKQLNQHS
jgi:hypothetical protein